MQAPDNIPMERTTIWSFPDRGNWATHKGDYRGNWSPYIPHNLISRYSNEREWILDQFSGSGTTLIEAKLLNRNAIGIDINPTAISITKERTAFELPSNPRLEIRQGNAQRLDFIKNNSIHLICTHPPYANMITYSENIQDDLSHLDVNCFLAKMGAVAKESFRVLKPGRYCAFMMGDLRRHGLLYPLGFKSMEIFTTFGFILKEIIIKEQHNCRSSDYWEGKENRFLLLAHEYIFVLQKPIPDQFNSLREPETLVYKESVELPFEE